MQQIKGIIPLQDIKSVDVTKIPHLKSNIKSLDAILGGFRMGELTVFTGKRGEGKSTFASQMLIEALDQGFSVCAYSGELRADTFQLWTHNQMAGRMFQKKYFNETKQQDSYFVGEYVADTLKNGTGTGFSFSTTI